MRELLVAIGLVTFVAGCSWFDSPAGSKLVVECADKSGASAGVRCGDDNDGNPPPVPE